MLQVFASDPMVLILYLYDIYDLVYESIDIYIYIDVEGVRMHHLI